MGAVLVPVGASSPGPALHARCTGMVVVITSAGRSPDREAWVLAPPVPSTPNVARVYDVWLGGKSNYQVDREAAARVAEVAPWVVAGARANRDFVGRAVQVMCRRGLRQFVDLGSGLPTMRNVHEVAQGWTSNARVVYVDHDPVVVAHARALLATDFQTGAVQGDLGDVAGLMAQRTFEGLIDPDEPVGVLATAVLHFVPDDAQAGKITRAWREVMAPGSHLVISHVSPGEGEQAGVQREAATVYADHVAPFTLRSDVQVTALMEGFELVPPGVVAAQKWRPGGPMPRKVLPLLGAVGWLPGGGIGFPKIGNGEGVEVS